MVVLVVTEVEVGWWFPGREREESCEKRKRRLGTDDTLGVMLPPGSATRVVVVVAGIFYRERHEREKEKGYKGLGCVWL
ncbi:hypothetical protein Hanom_Chr01g00051521 [Helianthus anomalus]